MKIVKIMSALIAVVMLAYSFTGCVPKKVEDTRPYLNIELRVYSDKVNMKSGEGKDDLFFNPVVFSPTGYQFRYEAGTEPTLMDVFKDVFENHPSGKASYTLQVNGSLDTVTMATKSYKPSEYYNDDNFKVMVIWVWDLNGVEMDIMPDEYKVKEGDFIRFYFSEQLTDEVKQTEEIVDETQAE